MDFCHFNFILSVRTTFLSTLLVFVASCKTNNDESEPLILEGIKLQKAERPYSDHNCKFEQACGSEIDPSICWVENLNSVKLSDAERLYAWRHNSCEGIEAVLAQACAKGWSPNSLGKIYCTPDSSEAQCPVEPQICGQEGVPVTCTPNKYNGQQLSEEMRARYRTDGANPCDARNRLKSRACKDNLNPTKFTEIECT